MKKALVLLLALVIFFCGTAYYAQGELLKEKDQVRYTENVLYGDKSVVEGVTVETNLAYEYQLYWENLYTIGETPVEKVQYSFYPWKYVEQNYEYSGSLNFMHDGTDIMMGTDYQKEQGYYGIQIAMKELYDNTPAGTENSTTVYLKDYLDYYSFMMSLELPFTNNEESDYVDYYTENYAGYYVSESELRADIAELEETGRDDRELKKLKEYLKDVETFQEFFKIPVIDTEVYKIAIAKDENGVVIGMGDSHALGGSATGEIEIPDAPDVKGADSFSFGISSVFDNGDCYFTFDPHTTRGELIDVSQIPGGYGLYHFTYDSKKAEIDLSNLKMVYPLNTEELITEICIDGSGKYILLFTINETENMHVLHAIDRDTMTLVDTFTLGDRERYITTWTYEDYIVVATDKLTVLELNENRRYVQAFSVDRDIMEERVRISTDSPLDFLGWSAEFDWDGETLVLVDRLLLELDKEHYYHDESCDFYVAAVNERGLLYYGEYYCSLLYSNDGYRNPRFNPDMIDALKISWK